MSSFNESRLLTITSDQDIQVNGVPIGTKNVGVHISPARLIQLLGEEEVIKHLDLADIAKHRGTELEKHYGSPNPVVVGSSPYQAAQREARTASVSKQNLAEERELRRNDPLGNRGEGGPTGPNAEVTVGRNTKELQASGDVDRLKDLQPGGSGNSTPTDSKETSANSSTESTAPSTAPAKAGTSTVLPPAGSKTAVGPTNPTVTPPDSKSPAVVTTGNGVHASTNAASGSVAHKAS